MYPLSSADCRLLKHILAGIFHLYITLFSLSPLKSITPTRNQKFPHRNPSLCHIFMLYDFSSSISKMTMIFSWELLCLKGDIDVGGGSLRDVREWKDRLCDMKMVIEIRHLPSSYFWGLMFFLPHTPHIKTTEIPALCSSKFVVMLRLCAIYIMIAFRFVFFLYFHSLNHAKGRNRIYWSLKTIKFFPPINPNSLQ